MKAEWRKKLHNEELHNLYSTPSVIRMVKSMRMRWEGHVALRRRIKRILTGYWWEDQKERPLGTPRRRLLNNIKLNLRNMGWGFMDRIGTGGGLL
jgi:hypothetical protein